jgi:hypothetical protein
MANQLTDTGREGFLVAVVRLEGRLGARDVGAVHRRLDGQHAQLDRVPVDITSAVWRARGTYLVNKTTASGIADADDTVVAAVGSAGRRRRTTSSS